MALPNPALDVATYLAGKTAGGVVLASGTNLFAGPMRADDLTQSPAVFVLNTGGQAPEPYLGGARRSFFRPTVLLQVRGPVGDMGAGEAFARGLYELLHLQTLTGYVACYARDAQPLYLGEDTYAHGLWSINLELQHATAL